jgi:type VI secretion system VgrG family protein
MAHFTQEAKDFFFRILSIRRKKTPIKEETFLFRLQGFPEETFHVLSFKGHEQLSSLYHLDILLVTNKTQLDSDRMLTAKALLAIKQEGEKYVPFHGCLISIEQMYELRGHVFYRVVMAPFLWRLTLSHHNQIFLNKTLPEIITAVLLDGGLSENDFEFRLQNDYSTPKDYVCQYNESHYHFMCRWLEQEGLYYYFELTSSGEKVIITDSKLSHEALPQRDAVHYAPPSGLDHDRETVQSFYCRQTLPPRSLKLKNHNYMKPTLNLLSQTDVSSTGIGDMYFYGDHYGTLEEGARMARIRAEEFTCQSKLFSGVATAPAMRPGFTFGLTGHYRDEFNSRYLTIGLEMEGSQKGHILKCLGLSHGGDDGTVFYKNRFKAIPADVQYRSSRQTPKPKCHGTITAMIDASEGGHYAELDEHGRYKVTLPFDISGRSGGKASIFIRMSQPYVGAKHGFHFPLHKGTEVLLAFMDGDPDRPVIIGAVPNPETPSVVTDRNQTQNRITTSGQNKIHIEDKDGSQRLLFQSPSANTWFRMGAPNDPPGPLDGFGGKGGGNNPITQLEAEIAALQQQVSDLTARMAGLAEEEKTDAKKSDLDELESRMSELESDYEALETEVGTLSSEVETLSDEVENLDGEGGDEEEESWADGMKEGFALDKVGDHFKESGFAFATEGPIEFQIGGGKIETIAAGGILELVILGGKAEFILGGLTAEVVLGGEIAIQVPHRLAFASNHISAELKHIDTKLEHLEANEGKVTLNGKKTDINAELTRLQGMVTDSTFELSELIVDANRIQAAANQVTAQRTQALADDLSATGDKITALGNDVRSVGSKVENAGTFLKLAGVSEEQSATFIKQAGVSLSSAGSDIRDAGLIVDG